MSLSDIAGMRQRTIQRLAEGLYGHPMHMNLDLTLRDEKGQVLKHFSQPAKSWQINMAKYVRAALNNSLDSLINTGGGSTALAAGFFPCNAGAGTSTSGIQVGSSSQALSTSGADTKLISQITHGAGAGNVQYGATSINSVTNPSGTTNQFLVTRVFTGNTGSTANIQEVGLVCVNNANNYLISRDLFNFGVLGAGLNVTATYTWFVVGGS